MPVARFDRLLRSHGRAAAFVLATFGALALIAVLVLAPLLGAVAQRAARPTPTAARSATPAPTLSASPAPSASGAPVTYESPILGYRISLPATYRRLSSVIFIGQPEILGRDTYTLLTEREEREECLRDLGDIPSPAMAALLHVEAYRNVAGVSATEWVSTSRVSGAQLLATHRKAEPANIGGREAVRLVADNATAEIEAFVIRAEDRIYVITPSMWPSRHLLEDVAATFGTIARQPFPTPTPTIPPSVRRQAATELAGALARAFAARDADAVARLMPDCHLGISPLIDGGSLPNSGGGGLSRSVALFTQALRDRFAAGDLTVTIDPTLQTEGNAEEFFVRSEWKEADRTTRIDMILSERDGRWQWSRARHYYQRADLGSPPCIPYRSPWVPTTSRC